MQKHNISGHGNFTDVLLPASMLAESVHNWLSIKRLSMVVIKVSLCLTVSMSLCMWSTLTLLCRGLNFEELQAYHCACSISSVPHGRGLRAMIVSRPHNEQSDRCIPVFVTINHRFLDIVLTVIWHMLIQKCYHYRSNFGIHYYHTSAVLPWGFFCPCSITVKFSPFPQYYRIPQSPLPCHTVLL